MEVVRGARTRGTRQQGGGIAVTAVIRKDYEREFCTLLACAIQRGRTGTPQELMPLTAVLQQHKSKVRPVMDLRQLNYHVDVFPANADVCTAKLRQKGSNFSLMDLKRAYLQVRVQKTLWPFQTVKIGGQRY